MKTEQIQTLTISAHAISHHFVDVNKTISMPKGAEREIPDLILIRHAGITYMTISLLEMASRVLDLLKAVNHTRSHIRPLAVRPLDYPEGVPNPWGFLLSGAILFPVGNRNTP